jgi:DNA-binding FadR family transcriptional regulator
MESREPHPKIGSELEEPIQRIAEGGVPDGRGRAAMKSDAIERFFERAILTGEIAAGDRLPAERDLSARYGASRGTVRTALTRLKHKGLIERRLGSGSYVRANSGENADEIHAVAVSPLDVLEVRRVVEPGFAELVVARATEDDFARMRARLVEMQNARDQVAFKMAGYNFHLEAARATRNPLLISIYEMIIAARARAGWARLIPLNDTEERRAKQVAHLWKIYEALRDRSQARAARLYHQSLTEMIQASYFFAPTE